MLLLKRTISARHLLYCTSRLRRVSDDSYRLASSRGTRPRLEGRPQPREDAGRTGGPDSRPREVQDLDSRPARSPARTRDVRAAQTRVLARLRALVLDELLVFRFIKDSFRDYIPYVFINQSSLQTL